MKRLTLCILVLFAASACTGTPEGESPSPNPLVWPEGLFDLQATVQYGQNSGSSRRMVTRTFHATLAVREDGGMRFQTDAGMCRDIDEFAVERQMARGVRVFSCGDATYTLRPAGATVRGEITVPFTQTYQEKGGCIAFAESGACLEYAYMDRERPATARAQLRVQVKA